MNQAGLLACIRSRRAQDDLFNLQRFASTEGRPFAEWIENNTYGHYAEHLADFKTLK